MSHVVSIRLRADQVDRIRRLARRMDKSQSEMGALLIEESLQEAGFANIDITAIPGAYFISTLELYEQATSIS